MLDSKLAGFSNLYRGEMYSGGVFPGVLILSSPSRIIPRGFNTFLARNYFFLGISMLSSPATTLSRVFLESFVNALRSLAKSREVPTVLQGAPSKPLSDRTNETWYRKMLTKLILTTLRVVININQGIVCSLNIHSCKV